ncbi:hypothetical protein C0J50_12133 [Silurus asotus]|uniref:Uncharacterized protein n=1 Tax=Silurus asotus TaxID=30991 RepID=A0AAD5A595_SILAS|nr:hypothetical protein C0J50_12133 [Silurus asotus]
MPGEGARAVGADQTKAPAAHFEEVLSTYPVDGAAPNSSPGYFIPSNPNQELSSTNPAHFLSYPTRSGPGSLKFSILNLQQSGSPSVSQNIQNHTM